MVGRTEVRDSYSFPLNVIIRIGWTGDKDSYSYPPGAIIMAERTGDKDSYVLQLSSSCYYIIIGRTEGLDYANTLV